MGTLVGRLMAEYVAGEGDEIPDDIPVFHPDSCFLTVRTQLNLPEEGHAALRTDLLELVGLRNTFVRSFIKQQDFQCLQA